MESLVPKNIVAKILKIYQVVLEQNGVEKGKGQ